MAADRVTRLCGQAHVGERAHQTGAQVLLLDCSSPKRCARARPSRRRWPRGRNRHSACAGALRSRPCRGPIIVDIGAVEADHHERAAVGDAGHTCAARGGCPRGERAGRRIGPVGEAGAEEFAVLDRNREGGEVVALAAEVEVLPAGILGELVEQAVDGDDGLVRLVLEDGKLAMILVDRTRDAVGGARRFQKERGERGVRSRPRSRASSSRPRRRRSSRGSSARRSTASPGWDCRAWCRPAASR